MNSLNLRIRDGREAFRPGDQLDVEASWQVTGHIEWAEIRLIWYTQGKGDQDVSTVEVIRLESPARSATHRVAVRLPTAPYSFSGQLISLRWALELVLEPAGDAYRVDIVMAPGAKEIVLDNLSNERKEIGVR